MTIRYERICPCCGRVQSVDVESEDMDKYENGAYLQDAFPYLTDEEREIFLSGICTDCWSNMFGDEEDEEC